MTPFRLAPALLCGLACTAAPTLAGPGPTIALDNAVYVERTANGSERLLAPARSFAHGDRLVYIVRWYRLGGSGGFTVTNPLPRSVAFEGSANGDEQVSVDGGKSWGQLGALRTGGRLATPEDVTHVRWKVPSQRAAAGAGRIAYSAIVR